MMIEAFAVLETLPRWMAYLMEARGTGKPTKVPYAATRRGGPRQGFGSSTTPDTWGTRGEAEIRAADLANASSAATTGVGVALGTLDDDQTLAGIDLDSCINDDGELAPWANAILEAVPSYAERSPSGQGIKIFFWVPTPSVRPFLDAIGVERDAWGTKRSIAGLNGANHGPGIEVYAGARFFTVTEQLWDSRRQEIRRLDQEALDRLARLIPARADAGGSVSDGHKTSASGVSLRSRARSAGQGRDSSRSARAASIAIAMAPDSYEEMTDGLRRHADPDIRAWVQDKGEAHNERELKRVWKRFVADRTKARQDALAEFEARGTPPESVAAAFADSGCEAASEPSPPDDGGNDAAAIARLARLELFEYERVRQTEAKRLGITRVSILDKAVKAARDNQDHDGKQGRPLDIPAPEPWPDPVDGVQLMTEVVDFFSDHAKLPDRGAVVLGLWAVHTHCYVLWRYTPRLQITGPAKRCGKTRVLKLVQFLVCKQLLTSRVTAPALYRSIEIIHPTLLIDEADLAVVRQPELLIVLDAGYERGQSALLTVGDDHEPRMFDLFAPVALAGIGRLAGQLEDRSIRLAMRRALPDDRPPKITPASEIWAERLLRQIARWVADNLEALAAATPDVSHLPDRVDDHWLPLYAIASIVGDNWLQLVDAAQKALTPTDHDTDSLGEKLLHDIHALWVEDKGKGRGEIPSLDLINRLIALPSGQWAEVGKQRKPLTTTRLASLLSLFEIRPGRDANNSARYLWLDFVPQFKRYKAGFQA